MQRFPSSKHRKQRVLHHKCVCTATVKQTTPGSRDKTLVKAPKGQNLCQLGMEQPGLPALWSSLLTLLSGNKQPHTWPQNVSFRIHQCFWRKQGTVTHHCAGRCLSILAFPDLLSFFVILQFPRSFPSALAVTHVDEPQGTTPPPILPPSQGNLLERCCSARARDSREEQSQAYHRAQ